MGGCLSMMRCASGKAHAAYRAHPCGSPAFAPENSGRKASLWLPAQVTGGACQGGRRWEETHMVREIQENELNELLQLYRHLHEKSVPAMTEHLKSTWEAILKDKNHHIIVKETGHEIVSSCVCILIPNLTRNIRPYALIENVFTREDCRGRGYATECLHYAREIAEGENCYKMMLLTSAKEDATLKFYGNAGYNSGDKTAFIQWLE